LTKSPEREMMSDWRTTRDEAEIVGETETGAMRPESDSGGSEQRNKCMKSLAICSLLQVCRDRPKRNTHRYQCVSLMFSFALFYLGGGVRGFRELFHK